MTEVQLLNPEVDAALARKMLDAVRTREQKLTTKLTTLVLPDREYCQAIGAKIELAVLRAELETIYERAIHR